MKMPIFILLCSLAASVHITEIMYNPPGSDNNLEFVEVYTGGASLENWTIGDIASNDSLVSLIFEPSDYALIVEEGYNYLNEGAVYSAGSTIGNNLNNDMDCIYLYDETLVDSICYDNSYGNDDGHSIELVNGTWQQSAFFGGSPGQPNPEPEISPVNSSENTSEHLHDACPLSIQISDTLYQEGDKVSYRILSETFPFDYWVEDLAGKIVKSPYTTDNTNSRSWTPRCQDGPVFFIHADNSCNHTSVMLVANCTIEEQDFKDSVRILEATDGHWGDEVYARLAVSKGDSTRTLIEVRVAGASDSTKIYATEKNTEFEVRVPIRLHTNCEGDYEDGTYEVEVSGLDSDSVDIEISGTTGCKVAECTPCPVCSICRLPKKPKIRSFYTLAKKYSDEIRLFANVDCPGNCSLMLNGIPVRNITSYSGKMDFNVSYMDKYDLQIVELASPNELRVNLTRPEKTILKIKNDSTAENAVSESIQDEKTKKRPWRYYLLSIVGLGSLILVFRKL